jgi:hypothetical protein
MDDGLLRARAVRLLQAADGVRVRVREPDDVDEPGEPGRGRWLRGLEQRPRPALLRLRLLQGRRARNVALLVATIALIFVYVIGCSAFRNAQTEDLFRRYKLGKPLLTPNKA